MKCPNINKKEVRDAFNDMVVSLGGKPLSLAEFKDSKLQSARNGKDRTSIYTVYQVFDAHSDADQLVSDILSLGSDHAKILNYIETLRDEKTTAVSSAFNSAHPSNVSIKTKYGRHFSYVLNLLNSGTLEMSKIGAKIMDAILSGKENSLDKSALLKLTDESTPLQTILDLAMDLYNDGKKMSILDVLSAGHGESSLFSVIDPEISFERLSRFMDGELSLFEVLDPKNKAQFQKELISFINDSTIDLNSPFSLTIMANQAYLAEAISSTLNESGISSEVAVEGVHYTKDSDGVIIVSSEKMIPVVMEASVAPSVVFAMNTLSVNEILKSLQGTPFRVEIDTGMNTVTVFRGTPELDAFLVGSTERLNLMHKLISEYYENTHAKTRSSLPTAVRHLSRKLVETEVVLSDSLDIVQEILNEAEFVLSKSATLDANGNISGIIKADGNSLASIRNSVLVHQLDVDLVPLAVALIEAIQVDLKDSADSKTMKRAADLMKELGTLRIKLDAISRLNYDNLMDIFRKKYNIDTTAIESYASRSGITSRLLYSFKYLHKSNSKELKYIAFLLNAISTEANSRFREYTKLYELNSILKELTKENKRFKPSKLFGRDSKGKITGFMKDRVDWGRFFSEYNKFMEELSERFGANGLYDFSVPSDLLTEYKQVVNDWVAKHTTMPTGTKYFEAIRELSTETFSLYSEYRSALKKRMKMLTPDDFINNTESFQQFTEIYNEYMQMFSPIERDGRLKDMNSEEGIRYMELLAYSEKMKEGAARGTSPLFRSLLDHAKKNLTAAEFAVFRHKFCGVETKSENENEMTESERIAAYNYNRALRPYENVIYDPSFIFKNRRLIRSLYELYMNSPFSLFTPTATTPLFDKLYRDMSAKYGEDVAIEYLYVGPYPNPIFLGKMNVSENVPSHIFSLAEDFSSDYSNVEYKEEFAKYDIYPNIHEYNDPSYDSLTDLEKSFIDKTIEILVDINNNNGTISLYGPVIPQVAYEFWSYAMRAGIGSAINYYARNRDVDISRITGFDKLGRVPTALFAKYSSMLDNMKALDRDLPKNLALAYHHSLVNSVAADKLYSLHTILKKYDILGWKDDFSIGLRKIYSEFGIDVNGIEVQEKGALNAGMIIKNFTIPFTRAVQLGMNLISFTSNAMATDSYIRSDKRFFNVRDINDSVEYVARHVSRSIMRKFNHGIVTEDKLSSIVRALNIRGTKHENEFRNLYGARLGKTLYENVLYFGYSAAESVAVFPVVLGMVKNIKYIPKGFKINGMDIPSGFYNKHEFVSRFSIQNISGERKRMLKIFDSLENSLFDAFVYNDETGKWGLDTSRYTQDELDAAILMAGAIASEIMANATGRFNDAYNNVSAAVAAVMGQNRQYAFNIINMLFTAPTYDIFMRSETEGILYSLAAGAKRLAGFIPLVKEQQKLKSHQVENLKIYANMVANQLAAVITAMSLMMIFGGSLYTVPMLGGDEPWYKKVAWRILWFIIATHARGFGEIGAVTDPVSTINVLFTTPATFGHYGDLYDMIEGALIEATQENLERVPTVREMQKALEYNDEFDFESLNEEYSEDKKPKKEPANKYENNFEFDWHRAARNLVPGYSGVRAAYESPKSAYRLMRNNKQVMKSLKILGVEKRMRWQEEYDRNKEKAAENAAEKEYQKFLRENGLLD